MFKVTEELIGIKLMLIKSRAGGGYCMLRLMLVDLLCVDRRHFLVIIITEQCLSVVNPIIIEEGELFTTKLIFTE